MVNMGAETMRATLYTINFLFVLTGIIIIFMGVSTKLYYTYYEYFIHDQYFYLPNLMIAIGIAIFVISLLGWQGLENSSPFLRLMFSTMLLLILFFELSIGVGAYFFRSTTRQSLINSMNLPNNTTDYQHSLIQWHKLQDDFDCCGVMGPTDYVNLPISCCSSFKVHGSVTHLYETCSKHSWHLRRKGCFRPLVEYVRDNTFTIEFIGFALATVQLIGLLVSCHLMSELRKGYQTV